MKPARSNYKLVADALQAALHKENFNRVIYSNFQFKSRKQAYQFLINHKLVKTERLEKKRGRPIKFTILPRGRGYLSVYDSFEDYLEGNIPPLPPEQRKHREWSGFPWRRGHRDRLDLLYEVLDVCLNPSSLSYLASQVKIWGHMTRNYINSSLDQGFLRKTDSKYQTLPRGVRLMRWLDDARVFLQLIVDTRLQEAILSEIGEILDPFVRERLIREMGVPIGPSLRYEKRLLDFTSKMNAPPNYTVESFASELARKPELHKAINYVKDVGDHLSERSGISLSAMRSSLHYLDETDFKVLVALLVRYLKSIGKEAVVREYRKGEDEIWIKYIKTNEQSVQT